jgi:hypothetical protein
MPSCGWWAANRKSRLGDHHAALSATAGMAGSAAFQSIRLKLLRYQNVNAVAPGPANLHEKASAKDRFGNYIACGFTQVTENSAWPENRSLLKRPRKWLSMSAAAYPGARTISLVWRRSGREDPVDGRQGGKTYETNAKLEKADRPAHRVIPKSRFTKLDTIDDVIQRLIGV